MKIVINIYDEIGIENPQLMLEKAAIVARIITAIETSRITAAKASEIIGVDSEYFTDIIRGHFHNTSPAELKRILTKILAI